MQSVYFLPAERSVCEGEELQLTVSHDDYSLWYSLSDRCVQLFYSWINIGHLVINVIGFNSAFIYFDIRQFIIIQNKTFSVPLKDQEDEEF